MRKVPLVDSLKIIGRGSGNWIAERPIVVSFEVTDACNIHCRGCYRQKLAGHKTLQELRDEVLFLKKWRNCDNISIAGGEPLIHPDIVELVDFIARQGMKPILLTNGQRLDREILRELKHANLVGVAFHVDSLQERPGWTGKSELELNALREKLAGIISDVGGVPCSFGITVYRENFQYIPELLRWTIRHKEIVQAATFITYRGASIQDDYTVGGEKLKLERDTLGYATDDSPEDIGISSGDVYNLIRQHFPEYDAAAYLGGTQTHTAIKWLVGSLVASKTELLGHIGPRALEAAEVGHHMLNGTYMIYRKDTQLGRKSLLLGLVDPAMREVAKRYLRRPVNLFSPVYGIAVGIIQAPDALPDGRVDMCDSCPDMTYYDGRLVNSCRLDEYRKFGAMMTFDKHEETVAAPN